MSRPLFVMIALCFLPSLVFGQWVVDESFETAVPPSGWVGYQVSGDPWVQDTSVFHSGLASAWHTYSLDPQSAWLISPAADLSGMSDPRLKYFEFVDYADYGVAHNVKISTNYAGSGDPTSASWTLLRSDIGAELVWVEIDIALTSYIGQTVHIAWEYVDVDGADWYIDDARIGQAGSGPGSPTDPDPLDLATEVPLNGNPDISWTNPFDAAYNKVYFSTSQADVTNMATAALVLDGTPATAYTGYNQTANLDFFTTYYWRIVEYSEAGLPTEGPVWRFTTTQGKAQNPVPDDDAIYVLHTATTLNWDDVYGSTGYKISIGTTSGGTDIANKVTCASSQYTHPSNWAFNTTHYWTVYTQTPTGEVTGDEWLFTTILEPISAFPYFEDFQHGGAHPAYWTNETSDSGEDWNVVTSMPYGATYDHTSGSGYFVGVSDSTPHLSPTNYLTPPLDLTEMTIPTLTFWYWIGYHPDYSTMNIDIFDGDSWHDAVHTYSRNTVWEMVTINLTSFKSAATMIRFRAIEHVSNYYSDVSIDDVMIFDDNTPPGNSTPINPANLETTVALSGSLDWTSVQRATGYKLYFGTLGSGKATDNASQKSAADNTVCRVSEHFSDENFATMTADATTYFIPSCSSSVSPNNLELIVPWSGSLNWTSVFSATGYKLFFGTDGGGVSNPTNILNGVDLGNVLKYNFSDLAFDSVHYWKIVPYNLDGDATGCPIWSFTTIPAGDIAHGVDLGNVLSYDYAGLDFLTIYYWVIVPYNTNGDAIGSPVWRFTTMPDTTITDFPWDEDFENGGFLPDFWSNDPDDSGENWGLTLGSGSPGEAEYGAGSAGDHTTGTGFFTWVDDTDPHLTPTNLITPALNLNLLSAPTLSFWYWIGNTALPPATYSGLTVDIFDGSIWQTSVIPELTGNGQWELFSIDIGAYKSGSSRIRFRAIEDTGYRSDICLDDISVFDNATIPSPAFSPTPVDDESAANYRTDLSWVHASGYPDGYRISLWYFDGPTQVYICNNKDLGYNNSYDPSVDGFDTLNYDQAYYWLVVPYNTQGDATGCPTWTFTVMPEPLVRDYPWSEKFTSSAFPPATWAIEGDNDWVLYLDGLGNYSAMADLYNWSYGQNSRLLLPFFDFTNVTQASLRFSYSHLYNMDNDRLQVILTNNSTVYHTLFDKSGANLDSNDGATATTPGTFRQVYIRIPQSMLGTQNLQLEFIGTCGSGARLFIDDIQVVLHTVIINELAWGGTLASPDDEWLELFNATNSPINISNWSIDMGTGIPLNFADADYAQTFVIPSHGYLVYANDSGVFSAGATAHITDTSIDILDESGLFQIILYDGPDGTGKAVSKLNNRVSWCGGTINGEYTMERIDPISAGTVCENTDSNNGVTRNGLDRNGTAINGTPGVKNSIQLNLSVTKSSNNIVLNWNDIFPGEISIYYNNSSASTPLFNCYQENVVPPVTITNGITDGKNYYFLLGDEWLE